MDEHIPVKLVDANDLQAELIEIDENLCRESLSPAQEAAAFARRKEIFEQLHPEASHGGIRRSSRQNGDLKCSRFTKATATALPWAAASVMYNGLLRAVRKTGLPA